VKVWAALLSRGTSTAGELSNISDVPRSRTYDILESLEKKGFIVMKLGKPIKFVALKPEEVVEFVEIVYAVTQKPATLRLAKGLNAVSRYQPTSLLVYYNNAHTHLLAIYQTHRRKPANLNKKEATS
jgi:hypothetical protein